MLYIIITIYIIFFIRVYKIIWEKQLKNYYCKNIKFQNWKIAIVFKIYFFKNCGFWKKMFTDSYLIHIYKKRILKVYSKIRKI